MNDHEHNACVKMDAYNMATLWCTTTEDVEQDCVYPIEVAEYLQTKFPNITIFHSNTTVYMME